MKFSTARSGRIFVIRLEHGEVLHEALEEFAREHGVSCGALIAVGGADRGSRLVVGPEDGAARPVTPLELVLDNVHELAGTGTLFPDGAGNPVLHMHVACGRRADAVAGCVRRGVRVWQVLEVVLFELVGTDARRKPDPATGFELLEPEGA